MSRASYFWCFVFLIWAGLLTGGANRWMQDAPPGLLQAVRMWGLLDQRREQLATLEAEYRSLEIEKKRLESSRTAQEREIRRVLGYVGGDEIVFEF